MKIRLVDDRNADGEGEFGTERDDEGANAPFARLITCRFARGI